MSKVLFVVYVPSVKPENAKDEEVVDPESVSVKDEIQNDKDDINISKPEAVTDGSEPQDKDSVNTTLLEPAGQQNEVTEPDKEDEEDPDKNVFFKTEKKKDCEETTSKVETEDSESCTRVESSTSLSEKESEEKKKPAYVRFLSEDLTLVEKVKRVLDDLTVSGVQWNCTEKSVHIGMFVANYGSQCEDILRKLAMLQIGVIKDSSVSVFPASISSEEKWVENDIEEEQIREDELSERVTKFKNSIKSRLVVDQVVNAVKNDAMFTFDYLMLVILASFVALMGLLESSSVVLVASMLISPLMGPILAGVFGVVIRKGDLIRVGIVNEIIGLTICVLIGFISGFIPAGLEAGKTDWRSSSEWPTPEMSSRGALRALPVGILIAIPSGAGVALSILGGKVGSLVGVAISASLLPPAVNAGVLWANAIVAAISPPAVQNTPAIIPNTTMVDSSSLDCISLINNDYERQYFCSMATESVVLGFISLLLTILNIFCIIFMGVIVLKIKEVAPIPNSFIPESENEFFCQDLRIARESNITMKGQAATAIRKEWLKSYQEMKSQFGKQDDEEEEEDENELDNIIDEVEGSPSVINIYDKMLINPPRWSRMMSALPSNYSGGSRFDFSTPSPSTKGDAENGIELRRRTPRSASSQTPKSDQEMKEEEESNSVYFTVHRYIHPRDLLKRESYSYKSGKKIKALKVPKPSRFMIARVEEDPEQKSSEKVSLLATVSETSETTTTEAQPLLNSENSNVTE